MGSKSDIWCCSCPKCLFVYVILSPFISDDEAVAIFGENLFEKTGLLETYKKLSGVLPDKPFECVGSRDEVLTASEYVCQRLKSEGKKLPEILRYFDSEVSIPHSTMTDYMQFYDVENCLPETFRDLLIKELKERASNVPKY